MGPEALLEIMSATVQLTQKYITLDMLETREIVRELQAIFGHFSS